MTSTKVEKPVGVQPIAGNKEFGTEKAPPRTPKVSKEKPSEAALEKGEAGSSKTS